MSQGAVGGTAPAGPHLRVTFVFEEHLGHETYARNLAAALDRHDDVAARWVPVAYAETTAWWERLAPGGLRGTLRGRSEVATGLRGDQSDVRVFNTQVPAVIGPRAARARPYVICTDVTPVQYDAMAAGYQHRADRPGPARSVKHRWNSHVLRGAAAHAPWSHWVARSLVGDYGIDPARIEVIPPGIDTQRWRAPERPDGPVRYLFVGGDFERKGGTRLLQAFRQVAGADDELHVVTRSDVPSQPGLHVHHGLSPNDRALRELFERSDVFVLPSGSETFGIAAIEATAAGLPVIASRVGGLADLVVDGETGLLTPPDDAGALAEAMRRLGADGGLRRRMGAAARARAVREFDAATNAARLLEVARRARSATA